MSHGNSRTKEFKKFIWFSLYAWGFPCLMTFFIFTMDSQEYLPDVFKPNIGKRSCWFGMKIYFKFDFFLLLTRFYFFFKIFTENRSPGHKIFFLVPIGIQILVNLVLFIITAIHCSRIRLKINEMRLTDNGDRNRKRYKADKAM